MRSPKTPIAILSSTIIDVSDGGAITPAGDVRSYELIAILFGTDSALSSGRRGGVLIPMRFLQSNLYYPLCINATNGYVRLGIDDGIIKVLSSSFASLYAGNVIGYL